MKYMLLIYSPEKAWTSEESQQCVAKSTEICQELAVRGQLIDASPLHPVATAITVRVRGGQVLVSDGPFAETTEQLGGYYLIDVAHLDEAIAIAERLPPAAKGTVEIRPLAEMNGLPDSHPELYDPSLRRYMLLCYDDETHWEQVGTDALQSARELAVSLAKDLEQQGRFISASPLHPSATATSVRKRFERKIITDGPFAETREVLGGYYLMLAQNREEVLSVASRHPGVFTGAVEVREVFRPAGLNLRN